MRCVCVLRCKLLGLSAGCFSHGEVEDSNPWGPDLLPYACAARDAGCLYQVGYVGRECQMQSVSQKRYAFLPPACVTVGRWHLSMPCLGNMPVLLSLALAVFWVLKMRIYTEAFISQKHLTLTPINHSYETSKKSCRTLQSCYSLNIYGTWTQVIYKYFWELLCHCPFPCLIFELEWSMGLWALSVIPISYRSNKQEEVRKINAFCNSIGERSRMMLVWGYSGSRSACWARRSKMSLVCESREMNLPAFGCCSGKAGEIPEQVTRDHLLCVPDMMKGFGVMQVEGKAREGVTSSGVLVIVLP